MFRYAVALLALLSAQTRADIVEDGLAHVEKLSQMTATQRQKISEIASASQELAILRHQTHSNALNKTLRLHSEMSMKKAEALNCHPNVLEEISWASEQALDDWRACLNISIPLGHMIELGINFTTNLEKAEAIICQGMRNVTLCKKASVFDKFVCVSEAIEDCTETFMENTKGVLYWISKFDDVLQELGVQIARCLNITNIYFFKDLETRFDERCQNMVK